MTKRKKTERQEKLLPKSKKELKQYKIDLNKVNKEIFKGNKLDENWGSLWSKKRFLIAQLNYWNK